MYSQRANNNNNNKTEKRLSENYYLVHTGIYIYIYYIMYTYI